MMDRNASASRTQRSRNSRGKEKEVFQNDEESGKKLTWRPTNNSQSVNTSKGETGKFSRKDLLEVEICGICLSEVGKETGKLDSCSHRYCLGCIKQWASIETRCPLCKKRFSTITMSGSSCSATTSSHETSKIIFGYPRKDQNSSPSGLSYRIVTENSEPPLVRSERNNFHVAFEHGEEVEAGRQEGFIRLKLVLDPDE